MTQSGHQVVASRTGARARWTLVRSEITRLLTVAERGIDAALCRNTEVRPDMVRIVG